MCRWCSEFKISHLPLFEWYFEGELSVYILTLIMRVSYLRAKIESIFCHFSVVHVWGHVHILITKRLLISSTTAIQDSFSKEPGRTGNHSFSRHCRQKKGIFDSLSIEINKTLQVRCTGYCNYIIRSVGHSWRENCEIKDSEAPPSFMIDMLTTVCVMNTCRGTAEHRSRLNYSLHCCLHYQMQNLTAQKLLA